MAFQMINLPAMSVADTQAAVQTWDVPDNIKSAVMNQVNMQAAREEVRTDLNAPFLSPDQQQTLKVVKTIKVMTSLMLDIGNIMINVNSFSQFSIVPK